MNSPLNPGDIVELPDGRRLMIVSPEEALRVCRDIQVWYYGTYSNEWCKERPPGDMRAIFDDIFLEIWGEYTFAVEVEPPKPEYV